MADVQTLAELASRLFSKPPSLQVRGKPEEPRIHGCFSSERDIGGFSCSQLAGERPGGRGGGGAADS